MPEFWLIYVISFEPKKQRMKHIICYIFYSFSRTSWIPGLNKDTDIHRDRPFHMGKDLNSGHNHGCNLKHRLNHYHIGWNSRWKLMCNQKCIARSPIGSNTISHRDWLLEGQKYFLGLSKWCIVREYSMIFTFRRTLEARSGRNYVKSIE